MSNTNLTLAVSTGKRAFALHWSEDEQRLYVEATSQPQKGAVNTEILKKLKKLFTAETYLVSGITSRKKVVQIALPQEEVKTILRKLVE